jgi:hypothetical protein
VNSPSDSDGSIDFPTRRLRHPGRIIGLSVVIAILLAAAFVAGQLIQSPDDAALQNVDARVEVFAAVESRVVSEGFQLPAKAVPPTTVDIFVTEASQEASAQAPVATVDDASTPPAAAPAPAVADSERVVLSGTGIQPGTTLTFGTLIGEVSGRPFFAWPQDDPLYRNLVPGDKGADVRAIQETLVALDYYGVGVNGTLDRGTMAALQRLYSAAGYSLPFVTDGVRGVSWRELVPVANQTGLVVWSAPVGTVLSAQSAVLHVEVSPSTLMVQATTVELDALAVGTEVGIVVAGAAPVISTVQSVGAFTTDEATGASGYPVTIAMPAGVIIDPTAPIQIQPWAVPEASLAVPAVAVRQDGQTTYVLTESAKPAEGNSAADPG